MMHGGKNFARPLGVPPSRNGCCSHTTRYPPSTSFGRAAVPSGASTGEREAHVRESAELGEAVLARERTRGVPAERTTVEDARSVGHELALELEEAGALTVENSSERWQGRADQIEAAIIAGPEIERVIHLRTVHLGPEELLVAAKIAVCHDETAESIARGIDAAERRIRDAVPIARVIYLEPDIYQAAKAAAPTSTVEHH